MDIHWDEILQKQRKECTFIGKFNPTFNTCTSKFVFFNKQNSITIWFDRALQYGILKFISMIKHAKVISIDLP